MAHSVLAKIQRIPFLTVWVVAACPAFHFAFTHSFRTPKVGVLAAMLLWLCFRRGRRLHLSPAVMLLFCWPLLAAFWVVNTVLYLDSLMLLFLAGFAAALSPTLGDEERREIRAGLAWSGLVVTAYVITQKLELDPFIFEQGREAGGFFGNTNFSAHFLLLCLCLGRFPSGWIRWIGYGTVLLGIVLCRSRGVWLGALVFLFLQRNRLPFPLSRRATYLGLALVPAVLFFLTPDLRRGYFYLTHPRTYISDFEAQPRLIAKRAPWFHGKCLSLMTRLFLTGNSLAMVWERPLTGFGPGQFHVFYPAYANAWIEDLNMSREYRAAWAHNLVLDATIQLGLPWFALACGYLLCRFREAGRTYRIAFGLQLGISLFSLNYLNPMITTFLILLFPGGKQARGRSVRGTLYWGLLFAGTIIAAMIIDLDSNRDHPGRLHFMFPEHMARQAFATGDLETAWRCQVAAFEQDPFGPETLYNMGLIAWELGKRPGGAGFRDLALRAWLLNRQHHPHYSTARDQLDRLERLGLLPENFISLLVSHEQFRVLLEPWLKNPFDLKP